MWRQACQCILWQPNGCPKLHSSYDTAKMHLLRCHKGCEQKWWPRLPRSMEEHVQLAVFHTNHYRTSSMVSWLISADQDLRMVVGIDIDTISATCRKKLFQLGNGHPTLMNDVSSRCQAIALYPSVPGIPISACLICVSPVSMTVTSLVPTGTGSPNCTAEVPAWRVRNWNNMVICGITMSIIAIVLQ